MSCPAQVLPVRPVLDHERIDKFGEEFLDVQR
jgi:hypothetical protein